MTSNRCSDSSESIFIEKLFGFFSALPRDRGRRRRHGSKYFARLEQDSRASTSRLSSLGHCWKEGGKDVSSGGVRRALLAAKIKGSHDLATLRLSELDVDETRNYC
jgi:hypothetical protein